MSTYRYWQNIVNKFIGYSKRNFTIYGLPAWHEEAGTINVICIRNNDENSFNDVIRNNDILIVIENRPSDSFRLYEYEVTADPSRKKPGIAHLCEGAYNSYVVRPHRWIAGRTALCQDTGEVRVFRTNSQGKIMPARSAGGHYEWGYFGINVHDTGGFWNSSLGCIILEDLKLYRDEFKPLLLRAKEIHKKLGLNFSLFVINHKTLKTL